MIDLEVRDESGVVQQHGNCGLEWFATIGRLNEEEFPFLGGSLLPYADTMFNSRQVKRLRRELSCAPVRDVLGADVVAEIDRLCSQVENGVGLYLWFLGD
ncbi:hypothetical protein ACPFP2_03905 [Micromonospora citrea]|uniref:hypothetical protein n=1 Tax=Micromonospora citrea TaxID=47855 RepID=UPI003C5C94EE